MLLLTKAPHKGSLTSNEGMVSYRSVEKLLPYGHVETITLERSLHRHTVIFDCGCRAEKNNMQSTGSRGPFYSTSKFCPSLQPKTERDAQSQMLSQIDFSKSDTIQIMYAHLELNSSKAVCHSRELLVTKTETIKSHLNPQVKEEHQIKGNHNTTLLPFSTPSLLTKCQSVA